MVCAERSGTWLKQRNEVSVSGYLDGVTFWGPHGQPFPSLVSIFICHDGIWKWISTVLVKLLSVLNPTGRTKPGRCYFRERDAVHTSGTEVGPDERCLQLPSGSLQPQGWSLLVHAQKQSVRSSPEANQGPGTNSTRAWDSHDPVRVGFPSLAAHRLLRNRDLLQNPPLRAQASPHTSRCSLQTPGC